MMSEIELKSDPASNQRSTLAGTKQTVVSPALQSEPSEIIVLPSVGQNGTIPRDEKNTRTSKLARNKRL
jgi:hypothetical protein